MDWISVKDRLPEEAGSYLVCTKNGGVVIDRFYPPDMWNNHTPHWSGRLDKLITHWMPRPEPVREEP